MGCDIHAYVEVQGDHGWQKVGAIFENLDYNPDRPVGKWNQPQTDQPVRDRNYNLFAILADVRNGAGFEPIAEPRETPPDISCEVKQVSDDFGDDGHSHSWLLLSEILAYNWDRTTIQSGWVDIQGYRLWKKEGKPLSWCGSVSGLSVRYVSHEKMDQLLTAYPPLARDCYTQVSWSVSYRDCAGEKWWRSIETLKTLGNPDRVRMVFWFDS